MKTENAAE